MEAPDDLVAPAYAPTPQQWQEWGARDRAPGVKCPPATGKDAAAAATTSEYLVDEHVDLQLQLAAVTRSVMGPLEPSDAAIEAQVVRAAGFDFAPVPAVRMLEVNRMALAFFQARYAQSWAQQYLTARLGEDPAEHPHFSPGYAPAGWTSLVAHLRRLGVTDEEMTETGVATRARTGRLIDRFRDRAVMPIVHDGQVLGFVGRRHPALTDQDRALNHVGPKYLNTADTPVFHKGAQLFGLVRPPRPRRHPRARRGAVGRLGRHPRHQRQQPSMRRSGAAGYRTDPGAGRAAGAHRPRADRGHRRGPGR